MTSNKSIALGTGVPGGLAESKEPRTTAERLDRVEEKLEAMTRAFHATRHMLAKKESNSNIVDEVFGGEPKNKDNVPLNSTLIGTTQGLPYILVVNELGEYMVGTTTYLSLSAAAEGVIVINLYFTIAKTRPKAQIITNKGPTLGITLIFL